MPSIVLDTEYPSLPNRNLCTSSTFEHLRGMIYFTDGRGIYPAKRPVYETAFVFMEEDYEDVDVPPWAIKIILEEDLDF